MSISEKTFTLPVITLILLSFCLGTSEFIIVGILPDISSGLNVSITIAGSLVSIFAIVYAVGTPFAAALAGLFNKFNLIIALTIIFITGNFLCIIAPNYYTLAAARVVIAIVSGTLLSVSMAFVPDIVSEKKRASVVSWLYAGFSIASVFGVPIGTLISHSFGWRYSFIFITAFSLIMFILMIISLPRNTLTVRLNVIGQFVIFKDKRLLLSIFTVFFGASASYVLYTYLAPVFEEILHIPAKYISVALLAFGISVLFSNIYSGKMAEKNGVYKLRFSFLAQAVFMFALPIGFYNNIAGIIFIFILGFLMYLQNSPIQVNVLNIATKEYPGAVTLAASMNSFAFNFGIAFGSICGSFFVDNIGMRYVGTGGGILAVFALISAVLLYKYSSAKN